MYLMGWPPSMRRVRLGWQVPYTSLKSLEFRSDQAKTSRSWQAWKAKVLLLGPTTTVVSRVVASAVSGKLVMKAR